MSRSSDKLNIIDHETFLKLQHKKQDATPKIIRNAKYKNKHKNEGQQFPLLAFVKRQEKPQQRSRRQLHIKKDEVTSKRKGKTRLVLKAKISRLKRNILNYRKNKQEFALAEILKLQLQTPSETALAPATELIPQVQQLLRSMTLTDDFGTSELDQPQNITIDETVDKNLATEEQTFSDESHITLHPVADSAAEIKKDSSDLIPSATLVPKSITHSRRFRSYCDNCTLPALTNLTIKLLGDLQRFQKRAIANNSIKALAHLRYVVGFREGISYLHINKVKLMLIATDCEPSPGKGGLDETIDEVKSMCQQRNVPYCFPMGRRKLNYTLKKKGQISCVAILDYDGANATYAELIEELNAARAEYNMSFGTRALDESSKCAA